MAFTAKLSFAFNIADQLQYMIKKKKKFGLPKHLFEEHNLSASPAAIWHPAPCN